MIWSCHLQRGYLAASISFIPTRWLTSLSKNAFKANTLKFICWALRKKYSTHVSSDCYHIYTRSCARPKRLCNNNNICL